MNASVEGLLPPDSNRGPAINAVVWTCASISILCICSRLFTRVYLTRNPGIGDVFMVVSLIFLIVSASLVTVAVEHGLGRHVVHLPPNEIARVLYLSTIFEPIAIFSYIWPKIAVVILILNLMGPRRQGVWFLYFLLLVLFVSSALASIFPFAQCNPPSHFWHPTEPAVCWSPNVLRNTTIFAGSWSAFVDLCLSAFPFTLFWNLNMKLKQKLSISCLMGIGILAMICAIVKTAQLPEEESPDFTWALYTAVIWTFIETTAVIICACIPTLPQLFYLVIGKRQTSSQQLLSRPTKPSYINSTMVSHSSYNRMFEDGRVRETDWTNDVALRDTNHSSITQTSGFDS